jgi:hypothetical protein
VKGCFATRFAMRFATNLRANKKAPDESFYDSSGAF